MSSPDSPDAFRTGKSPFQVEMLVELPEDVIQERRWGAGGCGFFLGQNGGKDCGKDVFYDV